MGRRRGPSPRPRSASPPPRSFNTRAAPPPAAARPAPPPAPQTSGGGLGSMVLQGMALGTGSAIAHRTVDAILGSRHPAPAEATQAAQTIYQEQLPCSDQAKAFADCMAISNGEMSMCQMFFEKMQECRLAIQ